MPVELKNPLTHPFTDIAHVGLAIKRAGDFVHVGFLYRDEIGQIQLSHLAFHHAFRGADIPDGTYSWLEAHFHEIVQEQLAAQLLHVAEENAAGDIPYSIIHRGLSFDGSGKYVATAPGAGLTCATYILAIFDSLQIPLLDLPTWPAGRQGDAQWAQSILHLLAQSHPPASEAHIAAQQNELPQVVRYRPEEVGAAFTIFTNTALTFSTVKPPSLEILELLAPQPPVQPMTPTPS